MHHGDSDYPSYFGGYMNENFAAIEQALGFSDAECQSACKTAKKQEGISFLLIDIASPGVTVRPIINLGLHDEFCEVFFDDVRVSRESLVGDPNKGWSMAKALGYERIFLGSPRQSSHALSRLKLLAERMGVFATPAFQDRCVRLRPRPGVRIPMKPPGYTDLKPPGLVPQGLHRPHTA